MCCLITQWLVLWLKHVRVLLWDVTLCATVLTAAMSETVVSLKKVLCMACSWILLSFNFTLYGETITPTDFFISCTWCVFKSQLLFLWLLSRPQWERVWVWLWGCNVRVDWPVHRRTRVQMGQVSARGRSAGQRAVLWLHHRDSYRYSGINSHLSLYFVVFLLSKVSGTFKYIYAVWNLY